MRIITFQPALPHYRIDFFRRVHGAIGCDFQVFYSPTLLAGITIDADVEPWARRIGPLRPVGRAFEWQEGALSIPFRQDDVVVICGAPRTLSTLALIVKAKSKGAKVIWWGHFWTSTSKAWRLWIRMQFLRFCDGVLFYSDAEVDQFLARCSGAPSFFVRGLNNGVNMDLIQDFRIPYHASERENSILFIGRLTHKAQLSVALQALAEIPPDRRPQLEVIGAGEEHERLIRLANILGVEGRVTWHGAIIEEAKVAAIANRCRLFLYPGEVGLSLIHAMAYGLPAVVHSDRWKQMPEFAAFEDGVTGRAFAYGNARSLAESLLAVDGKNEILAEYSVNTLLRVTDTFNTRDMAARFVELVKVVAESGAAAQASVRF